MFCGYCCKELKMNNAKFCSFCGKPVQSIIEEEVNLPQNNPSVVDVVKNVDIVY